MLVAAKWGLALVRQVKSSIKGLPAEIFTTLAAHLPSDEPIQIVPLNEIPRRSNLGWKAKAGAALKNAKILENWRPPGRAVGVERTHR